MSFHALKDCILPLILPHICLVHLPIAMDLALLPNIQYMDKEAINKLVNHSDHRGGKLEIYTNRVFWDLFPRVL